MADRKELVQRRSVTNSTGTDRDCETIFREPLYYRDHRDRSRPSHRRSRQRLHCSPYFLARIVLKSFPREKTGLKIRRDTVSLHYRLRVVILTAKVFRIHVEMKTEVITEHLSANAQEPADVAVVIQTVLRPSLLRAVRSVFDQDHAGRIQVLIGIDSHQGDASLLDTLASECPANVILTLLDLGYSTSARHGGIYNNCYGGALRTILSYAANSRYVAYLDDDDWWGRQHLSSLLSAIPHKDWAFSYRWLVDRETGWPICRDEWDSTGPGSGINLEHFGGFVSPGCLLLDKAACHLVLPFWSLSPFIRLFQ